MTVIRTIDRQWMEYAACSREGVSVNTFYPGRGYTSEAARAKAVCASCPVRETCLEHAIANHEDEGVWGGKTVKERKQIVRERRHGAVTAIVPRVLLYPVRPGGGAA